MHELCVTCFGVGDGSACADRGHSSYLYEFSDATILIDCGEPVSGRYKASGKSYDAVDRILISHMHFDHVGGFFMLMQGFWLENRTKELPVHMAAQGIEPVRQLLRSACLFDAVLPFRLRFVPLKAQTPIVQGRVRITPFPTTHLDGFRKRYERDYPGHFDAFSFLMESGKIRVGHSADVGAVADLEPLLAGPLDLLLVELAHVQPEAVFARLKDSDIKKIVFTHLGRPHWEALEATKTLAASMLPQGNFTFAQDQGTIRL